MTRKGILYILLVLGLAVIGGGIWMLAKSPPMIDIPESNPVIYKQCDYIMRGEFSYLYIYDNGSVIYIEEKGLRIPSPEHPPTRTWNTGDITKEELTSLLQLFQTGEFIELDEYYQFPGKPNTTGGFGMGDMSFTVSVNSENLSKKVTAFGYLTPDRGETYPDMPSPLNEIYGRLRDIAENKTDEVYHESIKD